MKRGFSLTQAWTALALFAVVVPSALLVGSSSREFYLSELSGSLKVERASKRLARRSA